MLRILEVEHCWVSKRIWANFSWYVATSGCLRMCCFLSDHDILERVLILHKDWNLGTNKTK